MSDKPPLVAIPNAIQVLPNLTKDSHLVHFDDESVIEVTKFDLVSAGRYTEIADVAKNRIIHERISAKAPA